MHFSRGFLHAVLNSQELHLNFEVFWHGLLHLPQGSFSKTFVFLSAGDWRSLCSTYLFKAFTNSNKYGWFPITNIEDRIISIITILIFPSNLHKFINWCFDNLWTIHFSEITSRLSLRSLIKFIMSSSIAE